MVLVRIEAIAVQGGEHYLCSLEPASVTSYRSPLPGVRWGTVNSRRRHDQMRDSKSSILNA